MKKYFGGQSPLAELKAAKKELDDAQSRQEAAIESLPLDTLEVYEAKGRLLGAIEKVNRIARIAFDDDAATAALFNKDLIQRARQTRKRD
jgi:hypothetical protein